MDWKDIRLIVNIADNLVDLDVMGKLPDCCETEEGYYAEILKQYLEKKKASIN